MAHRGWDEAHWRELRAGWPVGGFAARDSNSPAETTAKLVEVLGQ
jgi:hypothetical protein